MGDEGDGVRDGGDGVRDGGDGSWDDVNKGFSNIPSIVYRDAIINMLMGRMSK